jgi:[NiFe] hydrogenase diaphorase moiety small subunit
MSDTVRFTIDGTELVGRRGQTIMAAADAASVYIPRLCAQKDVSPYGSCRVCTVIVNGRAQAACTQPVTEGMVVENDTPQLRDLRAGLIEMLFVEGNHYCPFCEKSGNCELQALAYRFGVLAPRFPYMFPQRETDMSHPDVLLDHNRCVMCARCSRASREIDGKGIFQFVGRGPHRHVSPGAAGLGATNMAATDAAASICPVGSLMKKRVGYAVPIGQRAYDHEPIGTDIEKGAASATERG